MTDIKKRQPDLPDHMKGGDNNPLGARALYLGPTLYRIHGTNEPWKIGDAVSSGCIRLTNDDIIDLYTRKDRFDRYRAKASGSAPPCSSVLIGLCRPMRLLFVFVAWFAGMLPVTADEAWNCTFPGLISPTKVQERFEVRATDVLRDGQLVYRIVENNERGVTAAYARVQPSETSITVGTLALDKPSGDFVIGVMVPGAPLMNKIVTGKCQKAQ